MSEILGAILLAFLTGICLSALFNVIHAFFPTRTEHIRLSSESSPGRAFFLGLVNFLFFGALFLLFAALGDKVHQIFLLPGILILVVISIGITFGLSGIVQLTGNRLFPEKSPVARTVWGTSMLYLACLTPFVGWFGATVYLGLLGLGAFILSFFQKTDAPIEN